MQNILSEFNLLRTIALAKICVRWVLASAGHETEYESGPGKAAYQTAGDEKVEDSDADAAQAEGEAEETGGGHGGRDWAVHRPPTPTTTGIDQTEKSVCCPFRP